MNYLSAENIAKSFGDRWLFKNISHIFAASQQQAQRFDALGIQDVQTAGELKLTGYQVQTPPVQVPEAQSSKAPHA